MLKRAEWTAAVLLTVAVGGLHLLRLLHAGGLWRDEAAAVAFATLPTVREVASSFQHEAFPLLFPLAVRGWAAVWGDRDLALRALARRWASHSPRRSGGSLRSPRGVSPRDAAAPALPSSPALEYSAPSERMLGVTY